METTNVGDYDVILISALGYVEGGFAFRNPISLQGLLAEFGPRQNPLVDRLISQAVLRQIVTHGFRRQHGFAFLKELRAGYGGRILVQPFPLPSDIMPERADWNLGLCYDDPLGAHAMLCAIRDAAVSALCEESGAELLDLPDPSWRNSGFTPRHLMRSRDGIHAEKAYGQMVLDQVELALCGAA